MRLHHLVFREIRYRKLSFALGVLSASIAVACLIAELAILKKHDADTEQIIAAKEAETRARMATLQDDYRRITKGLGFNVLILPRNQQLSELYEQDYGSQSMPEDYVERLAQARVATIQHLLPSLQRKLKWPEYERTILLCGVRGEFPIVDAAPKKPLLEPVRAGTLVLGWELHRSLKLRIGDQVKLLGRDFSVARLQPEKGTKDDITVWINLKEAQELLQAPGRISGILALECVCAADSLDKVRAEIAKALPETQVIEFQSQTLARAEARRRAATEAQDALQCEKENRAKLRQARANFAALAVPLVVAGSAAWIAFLTLGNVRERRVEIGILRALGLCSRQIIAIVLWRGVLIGLGGAVLGGAVGMLWGARWREVGPVAASSAVFFRPILLLAILGGTLLITLLASWLPALIAAQQHPAEVLKEA